MSKESYLKKSLYELLIQRSLKTPESSAHLKAFNAYFYFSYLCHQDKHQASQKQFVFLKSYLSKAILRLSRRMRSRSEKRNLMNIYDGLDGVTELSQIDIIVEQVLEITRPLILSD